MSATVTRRRVVRGAAWTVPVVAMSATAPAFAASGFNVSPCWCKQARDNAWDFIVYPNGQLNRKSTLPRSVTINGQGARLRYDSKGRAYYDLRRQPHSWTFRVVIVGPDGVTVFDRLVDVRSSSCPA